MRVGERYLSSASFVYDDIMVEPKEFEPDYGGYEPKLYDLIPDNDIRLKQRLEDFDFSNPPVDPTELSFDLINTLLYNKGLGLSANQCGLPYRVFVLKHQPFMVCFNPRIVSYSENDELEMMEGCLSYPGLAVAVKRPKVIRVRFQTPDGETHTHKFVGMTARVFQHELDHMEGITFLQRISPLAKDKAERQLKKIKRQRKVLRELAA